MSSVELPAAPMEDAPFSIGPVSAMTGIPEATLRVWERRYQFPRTARSRGGHRHYSHRDVLQLRWVRQQMDAGMGAGQAIRARSVIERDAAVVNSLHEVLPPAVAPDPETSGAQSHLLTALLAYDGAQATALLDNFMSRFTVQRVVLDIVGPTLSAIGTAWAHEHVDVATEHFASHVLRHRLLTWMQAGPTPHPVRPIVLACAPDELHEGSLLMLGVLLRHLRWPVLYLGQSLPLADIGTLAARVAPALLVFVAMSEASALALAEWPLWLPAHAEPQLPLIGYGGRAFAENPKLAERVPGALLGATLHEGSQRINRIMLHLAVLEH